MRIFLEQRGRSPDAGRLLPPDRLGTYRIGDTFSAANEGLSGRRVSDIAESAGFGFQRPP